MALFMVIFTYRKRCLLHCLIATVIRYFCCSDKLAKNLKRPFKEMYQKLRVWSSKIHSRQMRLSAGSWRRWPARNVFCAAYSSSMLFHSHFSCFDWHCLLTIVLVEVCKKLLSKYWGQYTQHYVFGEPAGPLQQNLGWWFATQANEAEHFRRITMEGSFIHGSTPSPWWTLVAFGGKLGAILTIQQVSFMWEKASFCHFRLSSSCLCVF